MATKAKVGKPSMWQNLVDRYAPAVKEFGYDVGQSVQRNLVDPAMRLNQAVANSWYPAAQWAGKGFLGVIGATGPDDAVARPDAPQQPRVPSAYGTSPNPYFWAGMGGRPGAPVQPFAPADMSQSTVVGPTRDATTNAMYAQYNLGQAQRTAGIYGGYNPNAGPTEFRDLGEMYRGGVVPPDVQANAARAMEAVRTGGASTQPQINWNLANQTRRDVIAGNQERTKQTIGDLRQRDQAFTEIREARDAARDKGKLGGGGNYPQELNEFMNARPGEVPTRTTRDPVSGKLVVTASRKKSKQEMSSEQAQSQREHEVKLAEIAATGAEQRAMAKLEQQTKDKQAKQQKEAMKISGEYGKLADSMIEKGIADLAIDKDKIDSVPGARSHLASLLRQNKEAGWGMTDAEVFLAFYNQNKDVLGAA